MDRRIINKVPVLNGQLLKLHSFLLAVNADRSETFLCCCYGDLVDNKLQQCVCTEFVWLLAPTFPYSLSLTLSFFYIQKLEKLKTKQHLCA